MKFSFYKILIFLAISISLFAQTKKKHELVSINFIGNEYHSETDLEKVITSRESPGIILKILDYIGLGDQTVYFDSLLIPDDIQALEAYYFDNGFFETSVTYDYVLNDDEAELNFHVYEGDPARVGKFEFDGIKYIDRYLQGVFRKDIVVVDTNDVFTKTLAETNLNNTLQFLRDNGYALVTNSTPDITVDTMLNKVNFYTKLDLGVTYKISDIRVNKSGDGKNEVSEELIKEIVGLEPEDNYSAYEIRRGQLRLYRTNMFSSAVVNGVIADTVKQTIPLNISTSVSKMNEIVPEIIFNNEDNAFNLGLGIGYARKNFLGGARLLNVNASAAAQSISDFITDFSLTDTSLFGYTDARVSIQQPFLMGLPINTKLEGYITLQKRRQEYNSLIFGAKLSLNFELPRVTYLTSMVIYFDWIRSKYVYQNPYLIDGLTLFYQNKGLIADSARASAENFVFNDIDDNSTESTNTIIGVKLAANKSNDLLFPTKGYTITLEVEEGNSLAYLAGKVGLADFLSPLYVKGEFTSSFYFPIYPDDNSTLALNLKLGNIFTYQGDANDIPINQRLYAGGSNSIRGWRTRALVPDLGVNTLSIDDVNDLLRGLSPGGFSSFEGSIESRNRIYGAWGGAVFVDYGNVWDNLKSVEIKNIAVAAGFGIRYYSEFAPVRIDFGFKVVDPDDTRAFINKKLFGETFEFHLGIGEAF